MAKNNKQQIEQAIIEPVLTEAQIQENNVNSSEPVELQKVQSFTPAAQLYGGISPIVAAHISTIEEYARAMTPGTPITEQQGAMYQDRLYRAFIGILETPSISDAISGLDQVMALFRKHSQGALHLTYTQRFISAWHVDENTRDTFTHLCLAFSTYSDPVKRSRYGSKMMISGDRNIFRHLSADAHARLVQYLTRYVYDAEM